MRQREFSGKSTFLHYCAITPRQPRLCWCAQKVNAPLTSISWKSWTISPTSHTRTHPGLPRVRLFQFQHTIPSVPEWVGGGRIRSERLRPGGLNTACRSVLVHSTYRGICIPDSGGLIRNIGRVFLVARRVNRKLHCLRKFLSLEPLGKCSVPETHTRNPSRPCIRSKFTLRSRPTDVASSVVLPLIGAKEPRSRTWVAKICVRFSAAG